MIPKLPLSPTFVAIQSPKAEGMIHHFNSTKSIPQTILLTGVEGVGKKSFAAYLAQLLFCDTSIFSTSEEETGNLFGGPPASSENQGTHPCGTCASCQRAIQRQWLDLYWFQPENDEESGRQGTHKIEAFRELKTKLGMGPSIEPYKLVVIADADRMTLAAANSILKMLEEPPQKWIFILTASDSGRLLPTIRSRCLELKMHPLSSDQIIQILKEMKAHEFDQRKSTFAARAALGSLSRAEMYLGEAALNTREKILGLLSNPASEWMGLIDSMSKSQTQIHLTLDLIETLLMDLLKHGELGSDHHWIHHDQKDFLLQLAERKKINSQKLVSSLSELAELRGLSSLTLNSKLLSQEILKPILNLL